jgi:hypothetical protein
MAVNAGVAMLEERIKVLERRIISTNPDKIKTSVCYIDNVVYLVSFWKRLDWFLKY